jgi:hypothetical protein
MLLVDTSGSMGWKSGCTCVTLACTECQPDCSTGEQNRWHELIGVLNGSYIQFGCEQLDRTAANGATYDINYNKPFYPLSAATEQRSDGLFERFSSQVRFAISMFDGQDTIAGAPPLVTPEPAYLQTGPTIAGEFSYAGTDKDGKLRVRPDGSTVGLVRYPSALMDYWIDNGIQNPTGEGGLFFSGIDPDANTELALDPVVLVANDLKTLKRRMHDVRPFGGTPIAGALDDLYFAFTDPSGAPPRAVDEARYVVLITDGYPDDDFHTYPPPGCDCQISGDCAGDDPALMHCPYPHSPEAAQHLVCGFAADSCSDSQIDKLYVVSYTVSDPGALTQLDAIAAAGGTGQIRATANPTELRGALNAIMAEILSAPRR